MKNAKKTVGILFGGMSAEHEVSIESAKAVFNSMDKKKFSPILLYINKSGQWCQLQKEDLLEAKSYSNFKSFQKKVKSTYTFFPFTPWDKKSDKTINCDIFFPVLHGPNGEDGKIQGLLELSQKPYVGANSLSSALAMNKIISKILFQQAGLKTPEFIYFIENDTRTIKKMVMQKFDFPVFVKPSSLGSSVGISKVKNAAQLKPAIDLAFKHDKQIIIERAIQGREIEVSVMGNQLIKVSKPGELFPAHEFYDYEDKYLENKTTFDLPAKLGEKTIRKIQETAIRAFQALFLNGMSRIDFFLENKTGQLYINEINTIPGFTEISMFPKLWELEGISFTSLITRLINYGFQYHQENGKNRCNFDF